MLTAWKNIAVFLDDSPASARLGDYAAEIARKHGAHLIGIYGINRAEGEDSASSYARGTEALGRVMAAQKAANEDRVFLAGCHFSEISQGLDSGAEFRVVWNDRAHHDPVLHSLHSDLVIVGHPKPHGIHHSWTADSLLRMTGIPVLIVPDARKTETTGEKVLIAWNGSREARRGCGTPPRAARSPRGGHPNRV